jgi:hypothetical protein
MENKLEVSFNSPQCGWMSIGFANDTSEFHTTTAYTPHSQALPEILKGLSSLLEAQNGSHEFVIAWSRNPEAYDFLFKRAGEAVRFEVIEYPTFDRRENEGEMVFSHEGTQKMFAKHFTRLSRSFMKIKTPTNLSLTGGNLSRSPNTKNLKTF